MSEQDDIGPAQAMVERGLEHHKAGDLVEAGRCYATAVQMAPEHADAHNLLGLARLQVGDAEGAVASIGQAVALRPNIAQYYLSLGKARQAAGDLDAAIMTFEEAIRLDPALVEALNDLGNAHLALGDQAGAIACYQRALEADPDYLLAARNLANTLHGQGRLREAERGYRQLLERDPADAESRAALALVLVDGGQYREAVEQGLKLGFEGARGEPAAQLVLYAAALSDQWDEHVGRLDRLGSDRSLALAGDLIDAQRFDEAEVVLARVLDQARDDVRALAMMTDVLLRLRRFDEAERMLGDALQRAPDQALLHSHLGEVYRRQQRHDEAGEAQRRALELDPGAAPALIRLARELAARGERDEAVALYRRAVTSDVRRTNAWYALARMAPQSLTEADLATLERLAVDATLSPKDRAHALFALGEVRDRRGEHARAFDDFRHGNDLVSRLLGYASRDHSAEVSRIVRTFPAVASATDAGVQEHRPRHLFVVGMPRSGTTLIDQVLTAHPEVDGIGESRILQDAVRRVTGRTDLAGFPRCVEALDAGPLGELAALYRYNATARAPGARWVTDKNLFNAFGLGLAAGALGDARVVWCRRSPLDTCLSNYLILFQDLNLPFSYDLVDIARYYVDYERLMNHWRAVLPIPILEVDYERFVGDQEAETRRLLDFLELDWDARCLAFQDNVRRVETASAEQVRRPIYSGSVERYKRYPEARLAPLVEALRAGGIEPHGMTT